MKLLIVDDDHIIIRGITNILQKMALEELEILSARNAIDALEIMQYNGIDLLVTDIEMPAMNGLDLIGETAKRGHCKRYIILSGFEKFEFARRAIQYHVIDYLLKPIDKKELTKLVQTAYDEIHKKTSSLTALSDLPIYGIEQDNSTLPRNLTDILGYLKENYLRVISLEELGAHFDLHPNYICHLFQNYLHTTFLRYLECLRLQKSVHLLLSSKELPIEQVAVASGFLSERQFYKVFKKNLNMTPGGFKRAYEKKAEPRNRAL